MSSQSHSQMGSRPGTAQSTGGSAARAYPLQCNSCRKPLATTCFWCACDCIFCEECTYTHFERSSDCPTCGTILKESDFTELVVTDATSATSDVLKTSMQALFTKRSSAQALSFSDLCHSLIRELDNSKNHTRFLLKQLLRHSNVNGRQSNQAMQTIDVLKKENTQLKQAISTERLQNDKALTDLQNRLQAREAANAELQHKIQSQEKLLNQFRQQGGGQVSASTSRTDTPSGGPPPPSSSYGRRTPQEPPLKGFLMQKEAAQRAQQQLRQQAQRAPSVLGRPAQQQAAARGHSLKRSYSADRQQPNVTPVQLSSSSRPYSSSSAGSIPNTPRIRDLSPRTGYSFTSTSGCSNWQGNQHVNKRRRGGTPTGSVHNGMSPNTAFAMNTGQYGGPNQYFNR